MPEDGTTRRTDVTTPVFWSSLIGILAGSAIAGLTYLEVIGIPAGHSKGVSTSHQIRPVVVVFCCLLCVRYYASIVFLSYDDLASPYASGLPRRAKISIFLAQAFQVLGCSLNIALLPVYGAGAATAVILLQALAAFGYWPHLAKLLRAEDKERHFRPRFLLVGDILILIGAATFLSWECGLFHYDETGAGFFMGVILLIFVVECVTTYPAAAVKFARATATSLLG